MSDLPDWLREIRLFLFDLDGVLREGKDQPRRLAGGRILPRLRELGREYRVATNTTTHTRLQLSTALSTLGLDVPPRWIHSVIETTVAYLRREGVRRCLVLGESGLRDGLRAGGLEVVEEGAEAVIVGLDRQLTAQRILRAATEVVGGARLVACHRGKLYRDGEQTYLSAGPVVAAIESVAKVQATVTGKPSPVFFEEIVAAAGVPPEQALMVGDSLRADVRGAAEAGLRTALALTGIDSAASIQRTGIQPDLVLATADDLADLLGERK